MTQNLINIVKKNIPTIITSVAIIGVASAAVAGTSTNTDFEPVVDILGGLTKGSLWRTVGLAAFVVGGATAIVRQSITFGATATIIAVIWSYGPGMISSIFSATF